MKFRDKTKDALEESLLKLLQMQGVGTALSASKEVSCVRKYAKLTHEDVVFLMSAPIFVTILALC